MKQIRQMLFRKTDRLFLFLSIVLTVLLLTGCNTRKKIIHVDPAFGKYIEAYTSGVISKKNVIRIKLTGETGIVHTLNETLPGNLFMFSPSVQGKAYWIDSHTIEFKPTNDLIANELYEVSFRLGKVTGVPSKYSDFRFNVQVIKPSFNVEEFGLKSHDKEMMSLTGEITTADIEESAKIEKIIQARFQGNNLSIKWQHNEANKTHGFVIENIKREQSEKSLALEWDGSPLSISQKGRKEIIIPAIGDFKVLNIRVLQDEEQYALVQFSEPIAIGQQLDGLINIANQESLSYTILGC